MILECRTCPARGDACGDCMISALVDGPSVALDPREAAVVAQFAHAGLIAREQVATVRARLDPVAPERRLPLQAVRAG